MKKDELSIVEEPRQLNRSGSLCPAVKAADMIGDKWTLLIMRELLMGATRYHEFQRAMPRISPTILSKRLKQMGQDGLLIKKSVVGEKATEYRLTRCGRELAPLVNYMSKWGLRWARRRMKDEDLDVGTFMWDFHRTLNTDELPDGETVFSVTLSELHTNSKWWLVARGATVDLCLDDPGKEVDLYITGTLPALAQVWMGDTDISEASKAEDIILIGAAPLMRTASLWFPKSRYADVRPKRFVGDGDQ
ncbi:helix-turn-helix domain-containing protein [Hyphomonas sp.]|uniref:winged helix-turn-helix transcriptional regulator n=1 Tax=Hyphomonas sp. TaxID=87 RepID=UPI0030F52D8C